MQDKDSNPIGDASVDDVVALLRNVRCDGPGRVEAIVVTPQHDHHIAREQALLLPGVGLDGDGPYKKYWKGKPMARRQISAVSAEVLDALGVPQNALGDNLVLRGIDLTAIRPGDGLRIGDAVVRATGASHRPCALLAQRTSDMVRAALAATDMRGAFFDALHVATIHLGDAVEIIQLGAIEAPQPPLAPSHRNPHFHH